MQHNLDDIGGARELAWHRINVARDDLEAAEMNFKGGYYRSSNNRAYYAIFHAIKAILALEQTDFKKHSSVIAYFNKEYIAKGIFSRELGKKVRIRIHPFIFFCIIFCI